MRNSALRGARGRLSMTSVPSALARFAASSSSFCLLRSAFFSARAARRLSPPHDSQALAQVVAAVAASLHVLVPA